VKEKIATLLLRLSNFHIFIFYLLLIFIPSQLGLHFWPDWALVRGVRVDYLSPTFYFTDLLIFLILILWFIKPSHKPVFPLKLLIFLLPLATLNIFFAKSSEVSIYRWFKVLEFLFLGKYIIDNHFSQKKVSKILSLTIIYSSLIAFVQFAKGSSLNGIFYWLGERSFNIASPGITIGYFQGFQFLRPYATFSHPNALAGYTLLASFFIFLQKKHTLTEKIALAFSAIILIITFSQNIWLAIIMLVAVVIFKTKLLPIFDHLFLALVLFSLSLLFLDFNFLTNFTLSKNLNERIILIQSTRNMLTKHPIFGIGLGNFTSTVQTYQKLWLLQPVHNIFLLLLSETGVIIFSLFMLFSQKFINLIISQKDYIAMLIIISIALTGLFDHYWLTLQQTNLLLTVILGITLSKLLK